MLPASLRPLRKRALRDLIPVCLGGDNASPHNHSPQPLRGESSKPQPQQAPSKVHRRAVRTKSTSCERQAEHTSRLCQSRTGVSAP